MPKPLRQSETQIIKRSQVNLNPFNPKRHSSERIKAQLKNFKKYGELGGITWNSSTGNLIDGHRRVQALDLYYKFDGTTSTDYDIKVEAIEYSDKEEKEQMTFMALANTRADYDLIGKFASDIDYTDIGLQDEDVQAISAQLSGVLDAPIEDFSDLFVSTEVVSSIQQPATANSQPLSVEESKKDIKARKQASLERAEERAMNDNAYLTLSFSDFSAKEALCSLLGVDPYTTTYAKGEEVLSLIP